MALEQDALEHWSKSIRIRPFWLFTIARRSLSLQESTGKPTRPSAGARGLSADVKYEIGAAQSHHFSRGSAPLYVVCFLTSSVFKPTLMMDVFTSRL